jgi:uncharacterized protein YndB with AHSA1/START domain/predicted transcriptional regulator
MVTYYGPTMEDMEPVFRALSDPNRRYLLDLLHERDGQTLLELQGHLPMTRFGVMKHLKILEEAGLVVSRRSGREKLHYLNRVPIQMVYDRWVMKYAQPVAQSLTLLKYGLEDPSMTATTALTTHIYEVYIRTTSEKVWQALTDGNLTKQYYFATAIESDWKPGSPYRMLTPDGFNMVSGDVLEIDEPRKLVLTFQPHWDEEAERAGYTTQVTYEIAPAGPDMVKLTTIHEGLDPSLKITESFRDGWALIASSLKTLLETGQPLAGIPAAM